MEYKTQYIRSLLLKIFAQDTISYFKAYKRYYFECMFDLLRVIKGTMPIYKQTGIQRGMPKVLQFPITNRCNLKCKTCNVNSISGDDISLSQVQKAVNDKLFSEINSVGVNGGEPFLIPNIEEYIMVLLKLPKLKNIYIISNGLLTKRIVNKLNIIYALCKQKKVKLGFSTSIDGFRDVHDVIRGMNGAFDKTITTYKIIQKNMKEYCDFLGVICTISKYNIFYINDLIAYAELNNINNISYQLAVKHMRLANFDISPFTVLEDNYTKMLAQEFFYSQFIKTRKKSYYFIYKYLIDDGSNRKSICNWADRDVTIDAKGNLLYCATSSKPIGHVDNNSLHDVFFHIENLDFRKELVKSKCNSCIHYCSDFGYFNSNLEYNKAVRDNSAWVHNYLKKGKRFG